MKPLLALLLTLSAITPLTAALLPLGEWNDGAVRTALEFQGFHIRNSGNWLERWYLESDPPLLFDRLLLDSPAVDLLDWDGRLLILRDDGILECRLPGDTWSTTHWTLELSPCASELIRRDNWLLPVSPFMPLLDLADPDNPVISQWMINSTGGGFGGFHACFFGDTLVGDYLDACGSQWCVVQDKLGIAFDDNGPNGLAYQLGWDADVIWGASDLIATRDALACATYGRLYLLSGGSLDLLTHVDLEDETVRLAARDSLLFASTTDRLLIYVVQASQEPYLSLLAEMWIAGGQDLQLQGDIATVAGDASTAVVSIADPQQPVLLHELLAQGPVTGVAKANGHLLVRQRDLHVLREEGGALYETGTVRLPAGEGLLGDGMLAVAASTDSLFVLDITDPFQPFHCSAVATPGRTAFSLDGHVLAHSTGSDVVIHSLENLSLPVERMRIPSAAEMLQADGGIVGWLEDDTRVQLLDVREPAAPILAGSLEWTSQCRQFAFCDHRLLLNLEVPHGSYSDAVLQTYGLGDPQHPTQLATRLYDGQYESLRGGADRFATAVTFPVSLPGYTALGALSANGAAVTTATWDGFWWGYEPPALLGLFADAWVVFQDPDGRLRLVFDDTFLAVEPEADTAPSGFDLQAFPNPFNPSTRVSFELQHPGRVTLNLFNLRGELVRVLLDESLGAGQHTVHLEGNELATGMYFLRLETRQGGQTRKVLLLK